MTGRVRLDVVLGGIATALVAAGLAVAFVPDVAALVPGPLAALDEGLSQAAMDHVLAVLLGLYVLWRLLRGRHSGSTAEDPPSDPSDGSNARAPPAPGGAGAGDAGAGGSDGAADGHVVGQTYTRTYERRLESLRSDSGAPQPAPLPVFREAAAALERARGHDASAARERVESGAWTDDPVAAAFVGGPDAGRVPLWRRLRGVVSPAAAFEARAERTLAALERSADAVGSDGSTAPGTGTQRRADAGAADDTDDGAPDGSGSRGSDPAGREGAAGERTGAGATGERATDGSGERATERSGEQTTERSGARGGRSTDAAGGDRPPEV